MLKPLADRILVEAQEIESKTESGLYIPETASTGPRWGVVTSISDGVHTSSGELIPPPVHVGQRVMFPRHAGQPIEDGDKDLLLMSIHELLVIEA